MKYILYSVEIHSVLVCIYRGVVISTDLHALHYTPSLDYSKLCTTHPLNVELLKLVLLLLYLFFGKNYVPPNEEPHNSCIMPTFLKKCVDIVP